MMALAIIILCVAIIALGLWIFIGIIINGTKGKSTCGNCKNCSEEFCSQRKQDNPNLNKEKKPTE